MLAGKRALVFGVANTKSIAWGIAQRWRQEGAQVFVTYQDERFRPTVEKMIRSTWGPYMPDLPLPSAPCDVTKDDELSDLFTMLDGRRFCSRRDDNDAPKLDAIMHSVAYAPTEAMKADTFLEGTTLETFVTAHTISAYSLVAVVRQALPYMAPGASVQTLSYIGSKRAVPNYNVMGPAKASLESCARALAHELGPRNIRVNCLSPGPVRTLAARGIRGFSDMQNMAKERAPMRRTADMDEITGVATFLASSHASAITGQTIYVDCGFSSMV